MTRATARWLPDDVDVRRPVFYTTGVFNAGGKVFGAQSFVEVNWMTRTAEIE
ncbi:hypothetical protein ACQY1H_23795 (plasmid) [Agrobacterium vitis]|uniref:hypothetical protein n=1 Tax=Agrobacterium vitis TaxID=373 RepID=UPI003D2A0E86